VRLIDNAAIEKQLTELDAEIVENEKAIKKTESVLDSIFVALYGITPAEAEIISAK
jgi:hypothetical protein